MGPASGVEGVSQLIDAIVAAIRSEPALFDLAVCAEMVFLELPFEQRVRRIAESGFQVEIWNWTYHDIDALVQTGARFSSMVAHTAGSLLDEGGAHALLQSAEESFAVAERVTIRERTSVQTIRTDDAPTHTGPVPQAVKAGGWIYVSAVFGVDATTHVTPDDAAAEAGVPFDNLTAILAADGATLTDVVRVGIVMRDLQADRQTLNKVWVARFGEHRPGRSAIQSAAFGRSGESARYMLEVTAHRG